MNILIKNTSEVSSKTLSTSTNLAIEQDPSFSGTGKADSVHSDVTLSDRTQALISGLQLVLQHHSVNQKITSDLLSDLSSYLSMCSDESDWLKHCKHVLCYPLASYLKNEIPPVPRLGLFRPRGLALKWWRNRMNAFSRRNTHFWYSWFQAKRATLPVSLELVHKAYEDHMKSLSTSDSGDHATIDSIFKNPVFLSVLKTARKRLMSILRVTPSFEELTPSHSAGYEISRRDGGQQNFLRALCADFEESLNDRVQIPGCLSDSDQCSFCGSYGHVASTCPYLEGDEICDDMSTDFSDEETDDMSGDPITATLDPLGRANMLPMIEGSMYVYSAFDSSDSYLSSMKWFPKLYNHNGIMTNCIIEKREQRGRETWRLLPRVFQNLNMDSYSTRPLRCTIQAVLEPNKIRIISKGESLPYYVSRRLQKALWGSLKDIPCFRLIGRPFSPTDLMDLSKNAQPDWKWFSIDYSAATDKLSWRYSGQILRFLTEKLPHAMRDLALRVLGPHRLSYPSFKKLGLPDIPSVIQQNGQLMGSVLSFPILCLANLGVFLENTKNLTSSWNEEEILNHVLVNGDDMVYAAPESLWESHIDLARKVGLEMSVGKAYVHQTYCNINSVSVHYDLSKCKLERMASTPWQIDYLNAGLLLGRHKVQERHQPREAGEQLASAHIGQDPLKPFVSNMNTIIQGSLPGRQAPLLATMLSLHRDEILAESRITISGILQGRGYAKDCLHVRNLFLPIALGGMGVRCPSTWKFFISKTDRYLARKLLGSCYYDDQLPTFPLAPLESDAQGNGLLPWEIPITKRPSIQTVKCVDSLSKRYCDVPNIYILERSYRVDPVDPFESMRALECY